VIFFQKTALLFFENRSNTILHNFFNLFNSSFYRLFWYNPFKHGLLPFMDIFSVYTFEELPNGENTFPKLDRSELFPAILDLLQNDELVENCTPYDLVPAIAGADGKLEDEKILLADTYTYSDSHKYFKQLEKQHNIFCMSDFWDLWYEYRKEDLIGYDTLNLREAGIYDDIMRLHVEFAEWCRKYIFSKVTYSPRENAKRYYLSKIFQDYNLEFLITP
jgi:hypothetical protein